MKTFDYESANQWLQDNWSGIKAKQVRECQKTWHEMFKVQKSSLRQQAISEHIKEYI
ncbi:hypothetical protein IGI39_004946 [Enterococcus sp. AZ135]|uniref:hypothetical protein n=1 Tax=unclassified Enterococcus TaxID=2608891 RepID=UPI003F1F6485